MKQSKKKQQQDNTFRFDVNNFFIFNSFYYRYTFGKTLDGVINASITFYDQEQKEIPVVMKNSEVGCLLYITVFPCFIRQYQRHSLSIDVQ